MSEISIVEMLSDNETVLWQGKPKKSAFLFRRFMSKLPLALLFLCFDGGLMFAFFAEGAEFWKEVWWFFLIFFAFHLLPVWLWIADILTARAMWRNMEYVVTDRRILISSGLIGKDFQTLMYKDINKVKLNVRVLDKLFNVGSVEFRTVADDMYYYTDHTGNGTVAQAFVYIEDCHEVYKQVQKIVLDIQSDIMYPNALRPEENPGYNTRYRR